jgi:hypothetical protein
MEELFIYRISLFFLKREDKSWDLGIIPHVFMSPVFGSIQNAGMTIRQYRLQKYAVYIALVKIPLSCVCPVVLLILWRFRNS